jgi:hypothetical protein
MEEASRANWCFIPFGAAGRAGENGKQTLDGRAQWKINQPPSLKR